MKSRWGWNEWKHDEIRIIWGCWLTLVTESEFCSIGVVNINSYLDGRRPLYDFVWVPRAEGNRYNDRCSVETSFTIITRLGDNTETMLCVHGLVVMSNGSYTNHILMNLLYKFRIHFGQGGLILATRVVHEGIILSRCWPNIASLFTFSQESTKQNKTRVGPGHPPPRIHIQYQTFAS